MAVDAAASTNSVATTTKTSGKVATKEDLTDVQATQDRFLKMLVAQMQNQDPMAPMDSSAITQQMAQLNTVSGIQGLNKSMEALSSSFAATQSVQATTLLGRTVMFNSDKLELTDKGASMAVDLAGKTDSVLVTVKNSAGNSVYTSQLGALDKGIHEIQWDGKGDDGKAVPKGTYTVEVKASALNTPVEATRMAITKVQGISQGNDGVRVLTEGNGEVKVTDLKKIL